MTDNLDLDTLLAEAAAEAEQSLARDAAERERLRAAFEAGTILRTLQPVDVYDPRTQAIVRLPGDAQLTLAEHEGDVLVGRLADSRHSVGVLYEEQHRWYTRKYFLPLAIFVDHLRIAVDHAAELAPRGDLKPGEVDEGHVEVAVHAIEALTVEDDQAILPRGTQIRLKVDTELTDLEGEQRIRLTAGSVLMVAAAVDAGDRDDADLLVTHGERALQLPFAALDTLVFGEDILTPSQQTRAERAAADRRVALQRLVGIGLGATAALGLGAWWWQNRRRPHSGADVAAAAVPALATTYAWLRAGNGYWYSLHGLVMDLRKENCLPTVRTLADHLHRLLIISSALESAYRDAFYKRVHVGWTETRHYRTDKDGQRHYTHSTWSKDYSWMWLEPDGLDGVHSIVGEWDAHDRHRAERGARLRDERLFHLLEASDDAEDDFWMQRHDASFAMDAFKSVLSMAFFSGLPAFYDNLVRAYQKRPRVLRGAPVAKPILLAGGAVAGAILAERYRRGRQAELDQNKYALGTQLVTEIKRVPGVSYPGAWVEFFSGAPPRALPTEIQSRRAVVQRVVQRARSFSYTYGSGWDDGRPLDSTHVSAGHVKAVFRAHDMSYVEAGQALEHFLNQRGVPQRLLRVLRNAIGTEILDAQMADDKDEAERGGLGRALWFSGPIWGAALIHALFAGRPVH
jgi:hypothetical protein